MLAKIVVILNEIEKPTGQPSTFDRFRDGCWEEGKVRCKGSATEKGESAGDSGIAPTIG
jgi:hypothetical protein